MEVFGIMFGLLLLVGGPLGLLVAVVAANAKAGRAERRTLDLEMELDALRLRVDQLSARPTAPERVASAVVPVSPPPQAMPLAPTPVAAPVAAPVENPVRDDVYGGIPDEDEHPLGPPLVSAEPLPLPVLRPKLSPEQMATWLAAGLGAVSLLIGAGFAVAVAVDRGWMGPGIRAGAGLLIGTALWLAAEPVSRRKLPRVGAALAGVGVGGLYSVLWATHGLWHLISAGAAFGLMALVSGIATLSAHRRGDRFAAAIGALGALLTPVLASTGQNRPYALFAYLFVVTLGTSIPAARRGWPEVVLLMVLGGAGLHLGWSDRWFSPENRLPALLGVVLLILPQVVAVLLARRTEQGKTAGQVSGLALLLLPLLAVTWLPPVDAHFYDAVSGLGRWGGAPGGVWLSVLGVALLPLPALLGSRLGTAPTRGLAPIAVLAALMVPMLEGFSQAPKPEVLALSAALWVPAGAAVILGFRREAGAPGALAALVLVGGVSTLLIDSLASSVPLYAAVLGTMTAGLLVGAAWPPVLLGAVFASAFPLSVAVAAGVSIEAVGAVGVLALAGLGVAPLVHPDLRRGAGAVAAALTGPALFFGLYSAWDQGPLASVPGLLPVGLGAVSLLGAVVLVRQERVLASSGRLASLVSAALLGAVAAVPLQLEDAWLTVAWALEAAAVAALAMRLSHPLLRWTPIVLGLAVSVRLVFNPAALDYGDAAGFPVLNWTLWTWGVPALALAASAAQQRRAPVVDRFVSLRATALGMMAIAVGFALVNVEVAHAFRDAGPLELHEKGLLEGMVRSIAWAVYGLGILGLGIRIERGPVRLVGFLLMLLAAGKVFAVDLWSLEGFVRVGSVMGMGATLLVSAWLFERVVRRRGAEENS